MHCLMYDVLQTKELIKYVIYSLSFLSPPTFPPPFAYEKVKSKRGKECAQGYTPVYQRARFWLFNSWPCWFRGPTASFCLYCSTEFDSPACSSLVLDKSKSMSRATIIGLNVSIYPKLSINERKVLDNGMHLSLQWAQWKSSVDARMTESWALLICFRKLEHPDTFPLPYSWFC